MTGTLAHHRCLDAARGGGAAVGRRHDPDSVTGRGPARPDRGPHRAGPGQGTLAGEWGGCSRQVHSGRGPVLSVRGSPAVGSGMAVLSLIVPIAR